MKAAWDTQEKLVAEKMDTQKFWVSDLILAAPPPPNVLFELPLIQFFCNCVCMYAMYAYIYIYIYVCMYMYIYIYIYIKTLKPFE